MSSVNGHKTKIVDLPNLISRIWPMSQPAIEILGLTKDYPRGHWKRGVVRSLDNLTFQVEEGEVFGFLGPNGAGKTTTLKCVMG